MAPLNPASLDEISENNFNKLCNKSKLQEKKSNYNKTIKKRLSNNLENSQENYQNNKPTKSAPNINFDKAASMYDLMNKIHSSPDDTTELENFTGIETENDENVSMANATNNSSNNYQANYQDNYQALAQTISDQSTKNNSQDDIAVSNDLYNNLTNSNLDYQKYLPYHKNYNKNYNTPGANDGDLLSKLNYIIHLLEEQQNERTNYITEELILYCFLGIFIIFIIDSFARASKYIR